MSVTLRHRRSPAGPTALSTLVALAATATISLAGPADRWQQLNATGGPPPPRAHAAMAYDRSRDRVLLFGGQGVTANLDDTWELDLGTLAWRELTALSPTRPAPRFSMVAGIDAVRDRMLVTTGQGSGLFNDVWSLDLATATWSILSGAGAPPPRRYGSGGGTFDPGGLGAVAPGAAMVLSHGFTSQGRFQDTWSIDLQPGTWRDATPGGLLPLPRCLHASTLVAAERMVMFGGCASGFGPCPLGDTWLLDLAGGSWTEIGIAPAPPPRTHPSLAALGDSGDAVLFGGSGSADFNDVWLLDAGAGRWTELFPSDSAPSPRNGASLVWIDGPDPLLDGGGCGYLLLFGGSGSADLWRLLPAAIPGPRVVHAVKSGSGVDLTWEHDPTILDYQVWRRDAPRFVPGASGLEVVPGSPVVNGTSASLTDPAPTAAAVNHYRVRHARCGG